MIKKAQSPAKCPFCLKLLDHFHHPKEGAEPAPGSASVCMHCGEFLEFDDNMKLKAITPETLARISAYELRMAKQAIDNFLTLKRHKERIKKQRKNQTTKVMH